MAVYDFNIDIDKAWRLTIPDIYALSKRFTDAERRQNYRAAMFVAAIYNVNRGKDRKNKPYTPEEILGEKKQKPKDMLEMAKCLTELHGGEVTT